MRSSIPFRLTSTTQLLLGIIETLLLGLSIAMIAIKPAPQAAIQYRYQPWVADTQGALALANWFQGEKIERIALNDNEVFVETHHAYQNDWRAFWQRAHEHQQTLAARIETRLCTIRPQQQILVSQCRYRVWQK